jgi:hypothetical protein
MTPLATPSNCSNPYARKDSAPSGIRALADELRRMHLLRTSVGKGSRLAWLQNGPLAGNN